MRSIEDLIGKSTDNTNIMAPFEQALWNFFSPFLVAFVVVIAFLVLIYIFTCIIYFKRKEDFEQEWYETKYDKVYSGDYHPIRFLLIYAPLTAIKVLIVN